MRARAAAHRSRKAEPERRGGPGGKAAEKVAGRAARDTGPMRGEEETRNRNRRAPQAVNNEKYKHRYDKPGPADRPGFTSHRYRDQKSVVIDSQIERGSPWVR